MKALRILADVVWLVPATMLGVACLAVLHWRWWAERCSGPAGETER